MTQAARVSLEPAETHSALSSAGQRNRRKDGEGVKGTGCPSAPLLAFILLLSPFVSPEPPGEQTPRKET